MKYRRMLIRLVALFVFTLITVLGNAQTAGGEGGGNGTEQKAPDSKLERQKAKQKWKDERKKKMTDDKARKEYRKKFNNDKRTRKQMKKTARKSKRLKKNKREFFLTRWFSRK